MIPLSLFGRFVAVEADEPLVAASAEEKGYVVELLYEFAVNDAVDVGEHLVRVFGVHMASGHQIPVVGVAGIAPDIFFRVGLAHSAEKSGDCSLILRLKGLSAKDGQSLNVGRGEKFQDAVFLFLCEGLAVVEIPGHCVEAAFAVMTAAGDEQTDPHAGAVRDIKFFNVGVIHFFPPIIEQRLNGSLGQMETKVPFGLAASKSFRNR